MLDRDQSTVRREFQNAAEVCGDLKPYDIWIGHDGFRKPAWPVDL
jgi:hypothetical protein